MAVSVATTGRAPELSAPVALFRPHIVYGGTLPAANHGDSALDAEELSAAAGYNQLVTTVPSALTGWTEAQIAEGRRWVSAWREAGAALERIHRDDLRRLDTFQTIAQLCGSGDYRVPPRAPKPTSGLIEQQHWFRKVHRP
jgi:hypothetical protein